MNTHTPLSHHVNLIRFSPQCLSLANNRSCCGGRSPRASNKSKLTFASLPPTTTARTHTLIRRRTNYTIRGAPPCTISPQITYATPSSVVISRHRVVARALSGSILGAAYPLGVTRTSAFSHVHIFPFSPLSMFKSHRFANFSANSQNEGKLQRTTGERVLVKRLQLVVSHLSCPCPLMGH